MKKNFAVSKVLNRVADILEMIVSFVLLISICIVLVNLVINMFSLDFLKGNFELDQIVGTLFNLIISIEFTRMLCRHTPDTIIDVLLFATARQIIVDHSGAVPTLLGVIAIAILFVIRKYLMPNEDADGNVYVNSLRYYIKNKKHERKQTNSHTTHEDIEKINV